MAQSPDVWQIIKDNPVPFTLVSGWLIAIIGWVRSRFVAYDARIVQLGERHDLEIRRLRSEHRLDRQEWTEEKRELEQELRAITRDMAQLTKLSPEQISPRRRPPRPKPQIEEEGNA